VCVCISYLVQGFGGAGAALVAEAAAMLMVGCLHSCAIAQHVSDGLGYIEDMLQQQLFAAIGKHIQPKDFAEYMSFHHKKLFHSRFVPAPFCYAIRRPDHYPDGTLAIEDSSGEPVSTITRRVDGCHGGADGGDGGGDGGEMSAAAAAPQTPMSFAINAATRVRFTGERYLHALLATTFAGSSGARLSLVARARQYSSFLLLVGKIAGPDTFEPEHGIILQNKDELTIPLLLEQMPTPKEFRCAAAMIYHCVVRYAAWMVPARRLNHRTLASRLPVAGMRSSRSRRNSSVSAEVWARPPALHLG
jgi:hypothetical protein